MDRIAKCMEPLEVCQARNSLIFMSKSVLAYSSIIIDAENVKESISLGTNDC